MAITVPHSVGNLRTTSGNTVALNLSAAPAAGSIMVVCGGGFDNISSISGYGVGAWTKIQSHAGDANHQDNDFWYGTITGAPSANGTVTLLSAVTWWGGFALELAGAQQATDALTPGADDAAGTTDSKTITTTVDNDIIITVCTQDKGGSPATATAPTGYTQLTTQVSGANLSACAFLIQTTHGLSTMNWTGFNGVGTFPSVGGVSIQVAGGVVSFVRPSIFVSKEAQRRASRW